MFNLNSNHGNSRCEYCGRKRPTYAVMTEDDQIVFACGECIGFRRVKDE